MNPKYMDHKNPYFFLPTLESPDRKIVKESVQSEIDLKPVLSILNQSYRL